jgi:hypothetical protein
MPHFPETYFLPSLTPPVNAVLLFPPCDQARSRFCWRPKISGRAKKSRVDRVNVPYPTQQVARRDSKRSINWAYVLDKAKSPRGSLSVRDTYFPTLDAPHPRSSTAIARVAKEIAPEAEAAPGACRLQMFRPPAFALFRTPFQRSLHPSTDNSCPKC